MLSHLFNKAIEWGWMDGRPAKINRFPEGQGRLTYPAVEQIIGLVERAIADGNAQVYRFIVIGSETARLSSEFLQIRCEQVDIQRCMIFVPGA